MKINKIQVIVLFTLVLLIFSNAAIAEEFKIFTPEESLIGRAEQIDKVLSHKRIILESISENDIKQLKEKGCSINHKLRKVTSFKCPRDFDLQIPNLKLREERIFHIVDLNSAQQINADDVWAQGITGEGINVVILDTGVDYSHPELSDSYLGGYDFYNNDNDPADDHGHGTHVAGIITANSGSAKGISPNAGFYMLKVCSATGSCPESDMMAAMEYAIDNLDAKIMSISIGGGNYFGPNCDFDPLAAKVNDVVNNGISVVVASGNDGSYVSSPACASKAIAVGAVDDNGYVTWWSNYGASLDIIAPGVTIYSTLPGNNYASWSGTSMSTPHVSGVIALLLDENPSLTDAEIKDALYSTATPASGCYRCRFVWRDIWGNIRCYGLREVTCTEDDTGAGIVNAYQAYLSVKILTTTTTTVPTTTTTTTTTIPTNTTTSTTTTIPTTTTTIPTTTTTTTVPTTTTTTSTTTTIPPTTTTTVPTTTTTTSTTTTTIPTTTTTTTVPTTTTTTTSTTTTTIPGEKCWDGNNQYLRRSSSQFRKFCKCAEGNYGFQRASYEWGLHTAYKYIDAGNNENWETEPISNYFPANSVRCSDGNYYETNVDYFR